MASPRKGKTRRVVPGRTDDTVEEIHFPEEVVGDSVPKHAYFALMRAFNDVKQKLIISRTKSQKLQEKNHGLMRSNNYLENKLEYFSAIAKENEALKEKVELSFQAFDEKYKESESLRKKLIAIKQEEENKPSEDAGEEQQDLVLPKDETASQNKTSVDLVENENETVDSCTQTSEEKTDEFSPSIPTNLLKNCGLEIAMENGKFYLLLSNRDALKQWIENETDGKLIIDFEKTPVVERFVQTDQVFSSDELKRDSEECLENKKIIIQLKTKIVDQANTLKRYREQHLVMADLLKNPVSKKVSSTSVEIQTEETEGNIIVEQFQSKQMQLLKDVKRSFLSSLEGIKQKMNLLHKELEYQKSYSLRLLAIVNQTKDVPKHFIASILLNAAQSKSSEAIKRPPIPRALLDEETHKEFYSPPGSYVSFHGPLLSMPVQETDLRLRVKIHKPRDPDYDPSHDEEASSVAPAEARSTTSESSGSIEPAEEVTSKHTLVSDNITRNVIPTQTTSSRSSPRIEQASLHDSDDIEVIDEDETGAAGGATGTKECPICFLLYTPTTSQGEYEAHVMGHFVDE